MINSKDYIFGWTVPLTNSILKHHQSTDRLFSGPPFLICDFLCPFVRFTYGKIQPNLKLQLSQFYGMNHIT